MHMVELSCEFRYEAAHRLPLVPEGHQCGRMHGHSYKLTVTVRGPVGLDGFVIDFADVKQEVKPVVAELDHRVLNDIAGLDNPTVENQLIWFWDRFAGVPYLHELRLNETATSSAAYRGKKHGE